VPLEQAFRDPDLATEISLLPKRLGVDAIIFFQDILTPLAPMGAEFLFRPGPVLDSPPRDRGGVDALREYDPTQELAYVSETLGNVRGALNGELPLLGFAGAPLTLAFFLLEGKSPGNDPKQARAMMRSDPALLHHLLTRLAGMTVKYLRFQIESGADSVQLFESVGDLLSEGEYREFAHPYHQRIFTELAAKVPTILFVKEQPWVELMVQSGADVLSVGKCVDLADAKRRYGDKVAFQGNVDNHLLIKGPPDSIDEAVRECIRAGGHQGHILNLNHGLLKDTPFDNACRVIDTCKATVLDGMNQSTASY
jgi:uroporphyrinogen decarboxylase